MEILASRIKLRLINLSDLEDIHSLHSLPETDEFNTLGIPTDIKETNNIIEQWISSNEKGEIENYTFVIEELECNAFIGLFGLKIGNKRYKRAEVWYKIHSKYWNMGYATESLKAVIKFSFETLQLHRVHAGCAVNNIGSIKVLEKAGMLREGRGRQVLPLKTGWSDNFEYSILETDRRD